MPFHDAYARRTPFELAFPDAQAAERLSEAVRTDAAAQSVDPSDRGAFGSLPAVAGYLAEVRAPGAPASAVHDFAGLLFHAYHFEAAGRPLHLLTEAAARRLVEGVVGPADCEPPAGAGYLQLPQHLVWLEAGKGSTPESADGIFWTRGAGGLLHLLVAIGMRPDRPGLAVVQVPEAPWADAPAWVDAQVREGEEDFGNVLPGGELEGLYAFRAAGEVLKLFARFCIFLAGGSARVTPCRPETDAAQPIPSTLPYRRVEPDA